MIWGPSIFEFIRSHVPESGPGLSDECDTLPDEKPQYPASSMRWVPDMGWVPDIGPGEATDTVRQTVELLLDYAIQPTSANKVAVYQHVLAAPVVSIVDTVIEALLAREEAAHDQLAELARSFVTEAADRDPVRFGIALMSSYRQPGHIELIQTLGRHHVFTPVCTKVLASSSNNPDEALWMLARNVTGRGRIHVIQRLAGTNNSALRRWLLGDAWRDGLSEADLVHDFYVQEELELTCARVGGLRAALSDGDADLRLLNDAGELIESLLDGGIDEYGEACPALQAYLEGQARSAPTVKNLLRVDAVKRFLEKDVSDSGPRDEAGWTAESRHRLRTMCDRILSRPESVDTVLAGLSSRDNHDFEWANEAADALGLDTWGIHWHRLQEQPTDSGRWHRLMARADERRIDQVMEFAHETLNLSRAPGEVSMGPGLPHTCVDAVLLYLRRFPGRGAWLVDASLKSPVVEIRKSAVVALRNWLAAGWPDGLVQSLERAAGCEPDENLRDLMQQVLRFHRSA